MAACATCGVFVCRTGDVDAAPKNCPMIVSPEIVNTRETYADAGIKEMARVSAVIESEGYCEWTRVEETMLFARRMGVRRLGVAFCVGLRREAKTLNKVFVANGFEVESVCCKTGAISKRHIGVSDAEQVRPGEFEPMCNPIGQAKLLNAAGTGLNVIFGLCVGHDSFFIKYSDAPVTCLVAKDRALAHNPVAAIQCAEGYFNKALFERHKES